MKILSVVMLCIISIIILFPISANGQWYQKRFGVESANELTESQINEAFIIVEENLNAEMQALSKVKKLAVGGAVLLVTGFVSVASQMTVQTSKLLAGYGMIAAPAGLLITGFSAFPLLIAISKKDIWELRKTELEKLKGEKIHSITLSPMIGWQYNNAFVGAQITVSIPNR